MLDEAPLDAIASAGIGDDPASRDSTAASFQEPFMRSFMRWLFLHMIHMIPTITEILLSLVQAPFTLGKAGGGGQSWSLSRRTVASV